MEISDNNNNSNNNNDTITTATAATTTTIEEGKGKVNSDHIQPPETPIIFDQKRWELQRRYLTNPFKYLGHTLDPHILSHKLPSYHHNHSIILTPPFVTISNQPHPNPPFHIIVWLQAIVSSNPFTSILSIPSINSLLLSMISFDAPYPTTKHSLHPGIPNCHP